MTDGQFPDTAKQLSSVDRAVTAEDNGSTISTSARLSQVYNTSVADLWEACTTAERLSRWFGNVSGDLVLGGEYHIEGNASGTVETCDPPTSFALTWKFGDELTHLTVRLEEVAEEKSRLVIEHSGDIDPDRWTQYGPGAVGIGWDLGLLGLALHLETGADAPAETSEWAQTDAARQFMSESSRRWADAHIAAGASQDAARSAEMRTTAFYLGTDVPES
jgi:uncharacterized protein YndB with AHSA1/START domain